MKETKAWLGDLTDYNTAFRISDVALESFTEGSLKLDIHSNTDPCDCYMENVFNESRKVILEAKRIKTTVMFRAKATS